MERRSFSAQIDDWVRSTEQRMRAVFRTAAQYTVENVIERVPVDTGYLRASFTATLDAPLPMRGKQGDNYQAPPYTLVINGAELGDTIYGSFVANYAAHVEFGTSKMTGRGMVRLAAQAWPQHVERATREAKARVASRAQGS